MSQTSAQTSAGDAQAAGVVAESHTIDINSAPQQEIELLPGIGPALAARVIEYRSQHGPFRGIEDLDKVRGIGPKMIEKLRPFVSFGTPGGTATTNPSPPGGSP